MQTWQKRRRDHAAVLGLTVLGIIVAISLVHDGLNDAINPVYSVGEQIAETARAHFKSSRAEAWDRVIEVLRLVGIPSPEERAQTYPHQPSVGMRQRVMAMYVGRKIEVGPGGAFTGDPRHPYTRGLISCIPRLSAAPTDDPDAVFEIPGMVPGPREQVSAGCAFPLSDGRVVHAVDGVDFDVPEGLALGLVGESGSGKTITGYGQDETYARRHRDEYLI